MKHPFSTKKIALTLAMALGMSATAVHAQSNDIRFVNIVELTGTGATAGTNFHNGSMMALQEINAKGGILGKTIATTAYDTQSNPGVAKGLAKRAVDDGAFAVLGPIFSGSIIVSMTETQRAEVPNITGGEASSITEQGNPYIFRTSFTQADAMPKVAHYISTQKNIKSIAIIYVNNDFGKGGRDAMIKAMEKIGVKVVADISTDPGQIDFSSVVLKSKQSEADAAFVYTNEEESARALREFRKQGWKKPIIGETTLIGQKVIDLAGDAANGAISHVGLTADVPTPLMKAFKENFEKKFKYAPDHNSIKGYTGMYMLKAGIEKVGKFDRVAVAKAMHGLTITVAKEPGILVDVTIDNKGDLSRESYMVEVKDRKQVIIATLPALKK